MSIRPTVQIGNKIIRSKAKEVENISDVGVQETIDDLIDSMRNDNLVGMAAPQIGKEWRIFVTEVRNTTYRKNLGEVDSLRIFINPVVIWQSEKQITDYEGCGSVACAQLFGHVERPDSVMCKALDKNGEEFEIQASGFLARIICHEIDHLNGMVFLDRMRDMSSLLDRQSYIDLAKK